VKHNDERRDNVRRGRTGWLAVALAALVVALAVVAAGCGGDQAAEPAAPAPPSEEPAPPSEEPAPPSEEPAPPAEEPSGEPKVGGVLKFARNFETQDLNPMGSVDNGSIFVKVQVFNTLVEADPDTLPDVGPGLAESWEQSEDGLTWTFHLREAQFSNGDPVTAEDVKFSLDRFIDPEINTQIPSLAFGIESIDIVDDKTIQINLAHRVGALLENLSVFPASIVSKKLVEAEGDDHWQNPVGTGPFKLKEWVPGSHIELERNEFYWEEGKPYVDGVRFDYIPDDNARVLKMQAGEVDLLEGVPFAQIKDLEASGDFPIQIDDIVRWEGIFLNTTIEPFDDPNVRLALNLATDKEAIREAVYGGVGDVANSMIPWGKYTAPPEEIPPYPYDPEQAKELIAAAAPDGVEATFLIPAGATHLRDLATVVQSQWAEVGVNLSIEEVDGGALFERFAALDYEVAIPLVKFTSDVTVEDEVAILFYDRDEANAVRGFFSGWVASQELYDLTQAAAKGTEEERVALWPQVQQVAMDEVPWVTLFFLPSVHGVQPYVQGFRVLPNGWWDLEDVWLDT
jgi:peptide/nickel transport system substrate-binding protein